MPRFFTLLLAASCLTAVGQCTADFDFNGAEYGLSPDPALGETFADGLVGQPYEDVLHVILPFNTVDILGTPVSLPLDSIVIEDLSLVGEMGEWVALSEIGLVMTPNNGGDSGNPYAFLGGNQYCVSITGTPDSAGVFIGLINTTAWSILPPSSDAISAPAPLEGFTLTITVPVIPGCTDESACNYDVAATEDDGSCEYESCLGCIIDIACNFDPFATIDDGSCIFICLGCTDQAACNFDSGALQDNGTCTYPEDLGWCDCGGTTFIDALGICGGTCEEDEDGDGICDDIDDCVGTYDACGVCNGPGAIYDCGCSGLPAGLCDCNGQTIIDQCGVCGGDGESCVGCTYLFACNYDPEATIADNETCEFGTCLGCTDFNACNFNPTVSGDDGSCLFLDAIGVCGGDCESDSDGDGVCDLSCNEDWDDDGLADCVDDCPFGDFDNDGVCDAEDPCVGVFDILGNCNGGCYFNVDFDSICDDMDNCIDVTACNFNDPENVECQYLSDSNCDCNGSSYDAIGICGGLCQSDDNGDGICDFLEASILVELDTAFYGPNTPTPEDTFDPEGLLDGYVSYIVYAKFENPTDVLSAVYADTAAFLGSNLMGINAPCGCWNPYSSNMVMDAPNSSVLWGFPAGQLYQYDTFWTIGMLSGDAPGQLPNFVSTPLVNGVNICGTQIDDGVVFITGETGSWPVNAVAGDDLKVAIARVTTCGPFSISGNIQYFVEGDQSQPLVSRFDVHVDDDFDFFNFGCVAISACNFNPAATIDDGSCEFTSCAGCTDSTACNYDPGATNEDGSCTYIPVGECDCSGNQWDAIDVCGGDCQSDDDADGICDDVDDCVGILDAIGVCGGDCELDANNDGICDEDCGLFHDSDGDGLVGTNDLLNLLTEYNLSCD